MAENVLQLVVCLFRVLDTQNINPWKQAWRHRPVIPADLGYLVLSLYPVGSRGQTQASGPADTHLKPSQSPARGSALNNGNYSW